MWLSTVNQDQSAGPSNMAERMAYHFQGSVAKEGHMRARSQRAGLETLSQGQRDELGVAGSLPQQAVVIV